MWVEFAKVEQTYTGVVDKIVREQFTNSSLKNLLVLLKKSDLEGHTLWRLYEC